jgi:hypothetical protein
MMKGVKGIAKIVSLTLCLLALALALGGCESAPPASDGSYVEVVSHDKAKQEAYALSMRWLSTVFRSSKAAIEYADKEEGTICAKGYMYLGGASCYFALIVDVRDDRSRLSFNAIEMTSESAYFPVPADALSRFKAQARSMTKEYLEYLEATKLEF